MLETLGALGNEDVFQQTLDYQTSAELTGDFRHVVSYGCLGYFRADSFELGEEARAALVASARATLRHLSETGKRMGIPPTSLDPSLLRRSAAFVSLHEGHELFGCVGARRTNLPLAQTVPEMTLAAALDDPRFKRRSAVPEALDIEISVLTPMKRIRDWSFFRLGREGVALDYGARSELLLPQVAVHGIDTETAFLEALARKAGLGREEYRSPQARLSVFRAQVFAG
jgi:hypothetical protein